MTDTTAALRMACVIMRTSTHYPCIATPTEDAALEARLRRDEAWSPHDTQDYGPLLLRWAAYDTSKHMVAILQALLDGTPAHAPGMGVLQILATHPGQDARAQAAAMKKP